MNKKSLYYLTISSFLIPELSAQVFIGVSGDSADGTARFTFESVEFLITSTLIGPEAEGSMGFAIFGAQSGLQPFGSYDVSGLTWSKNHSLVENSVSSIWNGSYWEFAAPDDTGEEDPIIWASGFPTRELEFGDTITLNAGTLDLDENAPGFELFSSGIYEMRLVDAFGGYLSEPGVVVGIPEPGQYCFGLGIAAALFISLKRRIKYISETTA